MMKAPSVPTYRLGLLGKMVLETIKLPDTCKVAVGEDAPTPSNLPSGEVGRIGRATDVGRTPIARGSLIAGCFDHPTWKRCRRCSASPPQTPAQPTHCQGTRQAAGNEDISRQELKPEPRLLLSNPLQELKRLCGRPATSCGVKTAPWQTSSAHPLYLRKSSSA